MNGVQLTVGQLLNLRLAHSVFMTTETQSLKVPKWRRWALTIGEVNHVDVRDMVRVAGPTHKEHAQQTLETALNLVEAPNDETVRIDGSAPPGFGEWRLKGVKMAWYAEMAPTDRQDPSVWAALWKTNLRSIMHEFMYRVLWKKHQVLQRVKRVKNIGDCCVWCEAQETVYHFVKSCPMVRLMYAAFRDVAVAVANGMDVGRWVSDDPTIALTKPTTLCVWWGLHRLWTLRC